MLKTVVRVTSVAPIVLVAIALFGCGENDSQQASSIKQEMAIPARIDTVQPAKIETVPSAVNKPTVISVQKVNEAPFIQCTAQCEQTNEYLDCKSTYGPDDQKCLDISGQCFQKNCFELAK